VYISCHKLEKCFVKNTEVWSIYLNCLVKGKKNMMSWKLSTMKCLHDHPHRMEEDISMLQKLLGTWLKRLPEFRNQQGERSNRDVHLRTFVHTIFVLSMVAKVVLQQSPGSLILKNY
jgi:hypothetical protein